MKFSFLEKHKKIKIGDILISVVWIKGKRIKLTYLT